MVALDRPAKWCSVPLSEVRERKFRIEAGVYDVDARNARMLIVRGKNGALPLSSFWTSASHAPRFKRNYVSKRTPGAVGFIGSAEMLNVEPSPEKFILESAAKDLDLFAEKGTVLLSCSGTIGNVGFVAKQLSRFALSQHVIKIICPRFGGYVYAFLKSPQGRLLVQSAQYGSVIQEIEPQHIASIPVPDAPNGVKQRIHDAVVRSYALRDESNDLLAGARRLLADALRLPPLADFPESRTANAETPQTFSVRLKELAKRFDGSYHLPIVRAIETHLRAHSGEVATVGDPRVSQKIILPGRFRRVYVEEGHGTIFIGGKQLGELDPTNKKYLSVVHHGEQIDKQLTLREGMTLVTCSGTIGRVALVGRHWNGWSASQHILRVIPTSKGMAGYLSVWLASEWARPLIVRNSHGAVIDEITDRQLGTVPVPLLADSAVQAEINALALAASEKRSEAYDLEREALGIMEHEVLKEQMAP